MYVVLSGRARFTIGEREQDAGPGTVVFFDDHTEHRVAVALENRTTVLAVGGMPGTITPSAWEWRFAAEPAYTAGDYDEAYRICAEGLEVHPEDAEIHYQLACYANRGGHAERAREHLRRALAAAPDRIPAGPRRTPTWRAYGATAQSRDPGRRRPRIVMARGAWLRRGTGVRGAVVLAGRHALSAVESAGHGRWLRCWGWDMPATSSACEITCTPASAAASGARQRSQPERESRRRDQGEGWRGLVSRSAKTRGTRSGRRASTPRRAGTSRQRRTARRSRNRGHQPAVMSSVCERR